MNAMTAPLHTFPCSIFRVSIDSLDNFPLLYATDNFYFIHGCGKQQFTEEMNNDVGQTVPLSSLAKFRTQLKRYLRAGKKVMDYELIVVHRMGGQRKLSCRAFLHADADDAQYLTIIEMDVTDAPKHKNRAI